MQTFNEAVRELSRNPSRGGIEKFPEFTISKDVDGEKPDPSGRAIAQAESARTAAADLPWERFKHLCAMALDGVADDTREKRLQACHGCEFSCVIRDIPRCKLRGCHAAQAGLVVLVCKAPDGCNHPDGSRWVASRGESG